MRYHREGIEKAKHRPGFAYWFYISDEWRRCRAEYLKSVGRICERCRAQGIMEPAAHVHHKIRLTPDNIHDPRISLNWENLEALCEKCHQAEHHPTRWRVDEDGHVDLEGSPQGGQPS